jgi:hypothetical protein
MERLANNAVTTLSLPITTTYATTVYVASVALFPAAGDFRILIDDELLLVTAVDAATNTFTVTRGIEGTTPATHAVGSAVSQVLTAAGLLQFIEDSAVELSSEQLYEVQNLDAALAAKQDAGTATPAQLDAAAAIVPDDIAVPQANKAAILNADAALAGSIVQRYGTTAALANVVPLAGEWVYDADLDILVRGDGTSTVPNLPQQNIRPSHTTKGYKIGTELRDYCRPSTDVSTPGPILIGNNIVSGSPQEISLQGEYSGISFRANSNTGYVTVRGLRPLFRGLSVISNECLKTPSWTADTDLANWTATNFTWVESGTVRTTNATFELSQTIASMDRPLLPGEAYLVTVKIKAFTSTVATDHILVYGFGTQFNLDILANTLPAGGETFTFTAKCVATTSGHRIRIIPSSMTGTFTLDVGEISVKRLAWTSTGGSNPFISGYIEQPIGSPVTSAATITPSAPCFHIGWNGTSVNTAGTAVITLNNRDHAFTTSSTPTIYWNDGAPKSRVGMTVTAYDVAAKTITVTAASGTGDAYPAGTSAVAVDNVTATINQPISGDTGFSGSIEVIPGIPCAFGTSGNIGVAVTGVVGQLIRFRYDYYDSKWYPTESNAVEIQTVAIDNLRVTGTGALLGTAAGTPAGAFGLTYGTSGSASPKLVGEAANGDSKTDKARFLFTLPTEYAAGGTVTLRVKCRMTGNVATAQTIDATCFKGDGEAGVGSDICATAAQTITDAFADYNFTITPTGLAAGDLLDIELTGVANDTGGTSNKLLEIGNVQVLLTVKQ